MSQLAVPDHVPADIVRDFDLYTFARPEDDAHVAWHGVVASEPPVFFTPHYGGFWVINRADLLEQAWPDAELFSSAEGVGVPPVPPEIPKFLPIDSDDPYHKQLRRPLNLALSPKAVATLSQAARQLTIDLIEGLAARGECEFVSEFSLKMPMELFLRIVDLPSSDRESLLRLAHDGIKHPEVSRRHEAMHALNVYLQKWVDERTAHPGDDLMSAIVNLEIDGRPLTNAERIGYMSTVMTGGLDTVGGMMALSARHLALNPDQRRHLAANPDAIPAVVEEILRRYSIPTVGRIVTRDTEFGGVTMRKGDRVMLVTVVHGVDDRRWGDALGFRADRDNREHMAFGKGTHRCPGAILARAELRIFLEEWLKRIPDFSIAPGRSPKFEYGAVLGLSELPLVWPTN